MERVNNITVLLKMRIMLLASAAICPFRLGKEVLEETGCGEEKVAPPSVERVMTVVPGKS